MGHVGGRGLRSTRMNHMWARQKTPTDEVILSKLVQLARGDVGLVNEAIRATRLDEGAIDLPRVVRYISDRARQDIDKRHHEAAAG